MDQRRNVFFFHSKDETTIRQVDKLQSLAVEHGFKLVDNYEDANIIASIGGDGAFLQAVRKTGFRDDCLYFGISQKKQPYLYCDFQIDETDKMIEAMRNDQISVRKYPVIDITIDNTNRFHCLNEISIRSGIIKAFVIDLFIDDLHFETFRGDGLIISTPTGSSGYNKSVHGALVDPQMACMQVTELASLNNNTYRTLGSPFVLSSQRKLRLEVVQDGNTHPVIGLDNEALSIKHVKQFDIGINGKTVKTVKLKDNSFWQKVKRTFL
ncbi:NAD kinase [Bacillus gobiensis]|uniref:NAD kinase n=1 Tax=Bacillus gobiensis TaxID=1441095 RepID=UPI003D24C54F